MTLLQDIKIYTDRKERFELSIKKNNSDQFSIRVSYFDPESKPYYPFDIDILFSTAEEAFTKALDKIKEECEKNVCLVNNDLRTEGCEFISQEDIQKIGQKKGLVFKVQVT